MSEVCTVSESASSPVRFRQSFTRLRWLFQDTIIRIENAGPDSHPGDLVVHADEIVELAKTLRIHPAPMFLCEHNPDGSVDVGMIDPMEKGGCSFALWNPLDATGGRTVAMFLRMCRLWVSRLDGLRADDDDGGSDAQSVVPDDGQCWVSAAEIKREHGIAKGTLSKWAAANPEIRRDATPADRERLKNQNVMYVYNERLVRNKLGPDTDDE